MSEQQKDLANECARLCGCKVENLSIKSRLQNIVLARQLFFYINRRMCPSESLMQAGMLLNKDHATVIYSINAINNRLYTNDVEVINQVKHLEKKFLINETRRIDTTM